MLMRAETANTVLVFYFPFYRRLNKYFWRAKSGQRSVHVNDWTSDDVIPSDGNATGSNSRCYNRLDIYCFLSCFCDNMEPRAWLLLPDKLTVVEAEAKWRSRWLPNSWQYDAQLLSYRVSGALLSKIPVIYVSQIVSEVWLLVRIWNLASRPTRSTSRTWQSAEEYYRRTVFIICTLCHILEWRQSRRKSWVKDEARL